MRTTVSAVIEAELPRPSELVFVVQVSGSSLVEHERLDIGLNGAPVRAEQLCDADGTRLLTLSPGAGTVRLAYEAVVTGANPPPPADPIELITYTRPSRYCESDSLQPTALAEFAGLSGIALLNAVASFVGASLTYVPGSSRPTDGAVQTLLDRRGVCRDYAHLVIALLRGLDIPARLASVYAPGLSPMDFHAVAEGYVDGAWHVVDATRLAPRQSLVRIATGRDAADTAFLTNHRTGLSLRVLEVMAVADTLPRDDLDEPVILA